MPYLSDREAGEFRLVLAKEQGRQYTYSIHRKGVLKRTEYHTFPRTCEALDWFEERVSIDTELINDGCMDWM